MRRLFLFALLSFASGCGHGHKETPYEAAQRRYDFMKAHGASAEDLCAQAAEVEKTSIDTGDPLTYQVAHMSRMNDCLRSRSETSLN